ncbi:MAG: aminotransferase class V-fold PLP-dependent enzyme [candidate division Zixibacteria bacterium]|nr:aminotransferase class V-fold PLP-dependent enzyme [candidate division Zixibacteria bacterium]
MSLTKLAQDGGSPVRTDKLPPRYVGVNLIGEEEKKLVCEVIDSKCLFRHYGPGTPHFANDLEREFKEYIGTKYALATATGSGAYFSAMRALEIGPGDEVIIPAFGWITDYAMVDFFGATPVFAAIDESMNISVEDFEAKITDKTKVVVIIYYQGAAARIDEIVEIAHNHGIKVFEDVAQACGCEYKGKKLGNWGDIACYSLQNNKIISCGDGGLLVTNDQKMYELAVRYHDLGLMRDTFKANLEGPQLTDAIAGQQWRINELSAAVGLAQLRKLPSIVKNCQEKAGYLRGELLRKFPNLKFRAADPKDDIGILVAFDLGSNENVQFFAKAYEAEGLVYGPTSWCETINKIPPVAVRMKENGIFEQKTFDVTNEIDLRVAKLAILPVYSDRDMSDITTAAIKVLDVMIELKMI